MIHKHTRLIGMSLLLMATLSASAQDMDKYTGSLLWRISGHGLTRPSYILGTHHMVNGQFAKQIAGLDMATANTEQVVGELLMDDVPILQAAMMAAGMATPQGYSYKTLLSDREYAVLDSGLQANLGESLAQMEHMDPMMMTMLYMMMVYNRAFPDFDPMTHQSIDEYMQRRATAEGKSVVGLETVQDQIDALYQSESTQAMAQSLVCSVSHMELEIAMCKQLDAYYRQGNLKGLYMLAFDNPQEPCPITERQQAALVQQRNQRWLAQLPQIMLHKPSLIAVGALHLPGTQGLLWQLQQMGYTVERVEGD